MERRDARECVTIEEHIYMEIASKIEAEEAINGRKNIHT